MPEKFPALNSPFSIGKVTIKNRFVMAPVTTGTYLNPTRSSPPPTPCSRAPAPTGHGSSCS